jgi:hypothetical protein
MRSRLWRRGASACGVALLGALVLAGQGSAAGPPTVGAVWSYEVQPTSARLRAEVEPDGAFTTFHFEYIARSAYEANVASGREGFSGSSRVPPSNEANFGSIPAPPALQLLFGLTPDTAYLYRIVVHNSFGTKAGEPYEFITQSTPGALLADGRGWEMVSPVDKNGGAVAVPGSIAGGALIQAASQGGAVAYASRTSFEGGQGAATASQYLATRDTGGWATQNITGPLFAGSYDNAQGGTPYRVMSTDLARALLLNGDRCRGQAGQCAVANPPVEGTDAPAGYQDYYLREGAAFAALLGDANAGFLDAPPSQFELRLAGADPDLRHVVLSSCAALTSNATEVPLGEGCDPIEQNLYEWSGAGLVGINVLPGQPQTTPGATLGASLDAISADGSRVYFTDGEALYLREGSQTKEVALDAAFQTASTDGTTAYYTQSGHLYRYSAGGSGTSTDLTPGGGVVGVLGATPDGSTVYFQDGEALKSRQGATTTVVASGSEAAGAGDYPPATATARIAPEGELLFASRQRLTGYDNTDLVTGEADDELFLFRPGAAPPLTCISCNPTQGRPLGPSAIPGAIANGSGEGAPLYRPRTLVAGARRVFFDSEDSLVAYDANASAGGHSASDVYEWEAQGEGDCANAPGCLSLISSGRSPEGASFADASANGEDAFFLTAASLVPTDPGSVDLYDARVGGGFTVPPLPLACEGDACQALPSSPTDPTLDTLLTGPGNPPVRYKPLRCRKGFVAKKGECKRKKSSRHKKHRRKKAKGNKGNRHGKGKRHAQGAKK